MPTDPQQPVRPPKPPLAESTNRDDLFDAEGRIKDSPANDQGLEDDDE